jgi:RNA-binding motif protein, X-linked 2
VTDEATGASKGFAFVKYEDWLSTVLAVDNLNGARLLGRQLRVDHKLEYTPPKPKEEEAVPVGPGAAYHGKELAGEFSLDRGVQVYGGNVGGTAIALSSSSSSSSRPHDWRAADGSAEHRHRHRRDRDPDRPHHSRREGNESEHRHRHRRDRGPDRPHHYRREERDDASSRHSRREERDDDPSTRSSRRRHRVGPRIKYRGAMPEDLKGIGPASAEEALRRANALGGSAGRA